MNDGYEDYKGAPKIAQDWTKIDTIEDMPFDLPKDINLGTFHKWMGIIYREHRALVIAAKSSGFDPKPVVTSQEPMGQFTPAVKDWLNEAKTDKPIQFTIGVPGKPVKATVVKTPPLEFSDDEMKLVKKKPAKRKAPVKVTQVTKPHRKR